MSPDVIFAIRYTYLTDPTATMATIGQTFQLSTAIVAQLLTGPEYEAIRDQIHKTTTQAVRDRLHAASELAADKWIQSFGPAAAKGDHRPMKDLLIASKVVDVDKGTTSPVVIQIGIQAGSVAIVPVPPSSIQPVPNPPGALPACPVPLAPPVPLASAGTVDPIEVQVLSPGTGTAGTGTGTE